MGPADQVTSHLYSFGIRGKQFQYVQGSFPKGASFHGRLTDNDVRKILDKGGHIQIVEPKYSSEDLQAARKACSGGAIAGEVTTQAEPSLKSPSTEDHHSPAVAKTSDTPITPASIPGSSKGENGRVSITSIPDAADVYVDGALIGNTPATLKLSAGKHTIRIITAGYKEWNREIDVLGDSEATLKATLEQAPRGVKVTGGVSSH